MQIRRLYFLFKDALKDLHYPPKERLVQELKGHKSESSTPGDLNASATFCSYGVIEAAQEPSVAFLLNGSVVLVLYDSI